MEKRGHRTVLGGFMVENSTFNRSVDLLQRNMAVSTLRREVIANNIANAETPNFKRSEVSLKPNSGEPWHLRSRDRPSGH
jgi:flagellar basal-body rod protein FlgB